MVEGTDGEVNYATKAESRRDLIAQGDTLPHDVHSHGNVKDGVMGILSRLAIWIPQGRYEWYNGNTINVVLGYVQVKPILPLIPSGKPDNNGSEDLDA